VSLKTINYTPFFQGLYEKRPHQIGCNGRSRGDEGKCLWNISADFYADRVNGTTSPPNLRMPSGMEQEPRKTAPSVI
jgi:hypothetical protein